jgi:putative hydrolase of the HAD superfamily
MALEQARAREAFAETRLWIFDLDNTLYPSECNLFAQIDSRMSGFIQNLLGLDPAEARRVQKQLYYEHGTTLAGLMAEHNVKPDVFMDFVHDIDLSPVAHAPELAAAISRLEGRKFIFTNGSTRHAERVAAKLGVLDLFDGIFDIAAGNYIPKPKPQAFERFLQFCDGAGCKGAMFEDLPHNLEAAHAHGLTTVLVRSNYYDHPSQHALRAAVSLPAYIHFETDHLTRFLNALLTALDEAGPNSHGSQKIAPTPPRERPTS